MMEILQAGLQQLEMTNYSIALQQYLKLLEKWNKAYNLTAIRDIEEMAVRHVFDSLAIAEWVKGNRLLDVGSGAGLPGIPLAITHPHWQVVLLDSNGKKVRFLQEVKRVLHLDNVEVVQSRVENYHPAEGFATVTSRAFSDLDQMLKWTGHLVAADGIWLAMKGRYPEVELDAIKYAYQVNKYTVPGLDGERCCVIIEPPQS